MPLPDPGLASDARIRELTAEVLARDEYAKYRSLSAEALRELVEWFSDALDWLPGLYVASPLLFWSVIALLALVNVLLITHIVWSVRSALRRSSAAQMAAADSGAGPDFVAEAERLASRGAHLEGAHRLLLATLAHAARTRVLELRPDDGNRTVCRKLRASALSPALQQQLVELIRRTEASWFGARENGAELYAAWLDVYGRLQRSAP
jgi:hypothetical protein